MFVRQRSHYTVKLALDLFIINLSFFIAAILAQSFEILLDRYYMFFLTGLLNVVWYLNANAIDFYDDTGNRYFSFQFIKILRGVITQIVLSVLFIFLAKEDLFTRNFIAYYAFLILLLLSARVLIIKEALDSIRKKGKNVRNLLIIGTGETARYFYDTVKKSSDIGYNIVGFLSNDNRNNGLHVISSIEHYEEVLQDKKIDETIIALSDSDGSQLKNLIAVSNRHAVRTHIIPDYFNLLARKFQVSMIGKVPIITVRNEPLEQIQWKLAKRIFDIVFSFLTIILLASWLFPLIVIMIRITSKGPAFFKQPRIGKDNKPFSCLKFRTMRINKECESFAPTKKNDSRITKIGRFLRKSNIDELPQLFNVLWGDMSIVGPRPHPVAFEETYGSYVEAIKLRNLVKPGITGWAQVNNLRGDSPNESENKERIKKRIDHDIWYIENWTFWLDIQIILLTVWQMIRGKSKGVY